MFRVPVSALSTRVCGPVTLSKLCGTKFVLSMFRLDSALSATRDEIFASKQCERLVGSNIQPFFLDIPANDGTPPLVSYVLMVYTLRQAH